MRGKKITCVPSSLFQKNQREPPKENCNAPSGRERVAVEKRENNGGRKEQKDLPQRGGEGSKVCLRRKTVQKIVEHAVKHTKKGRSRKRVKRASNRGRCVTYKV